MRSKRAKRWKESFSEEKNKNTLGLYFINQYCSIAFSFKNEDTEFSNQLEADYFYIFCNLLNYYYKIKKHQMSNYNNNEESQWHINDLEKLCLYYLGILSIVHIVAGISASQLARFSQQ